MPARPAQQTVPNLTKNGTVAEPATAKVVPIRSTSRQAPIPENGTVRRRRNAEVRPREHLTAAEVDKLMTAARKRSRYGHRDATLILVMYRHGLRVSEAVALRWDHVDLKTGRLHVRRAKGGIDGTHPLTGAEIRALRRLQREATSPYIFASERGGPLTTRGVRQMIARTGEAARFAFPLHPHMLRHGCGFKLANDDVPTRTIQLYLGHSNIANTARYTALSAGAFKGLWRD